MDERLEIPEYYLHDPHEVRDEPCCEDCDALLGREPTLIKWEDDLGWPYCKKCGIVRIEQAIGALYSMRKKLETT